ncbi:ThiF family adenylyltransferase [candidate division CSSED10-310 bacterium]|uniref:ThiF family adenylyltransferase n=1 Tax=candidate division CSSED10-310 bacterium TaxID=2855610 RepID=A0ABV6Z3D7_UNCC1
MNTKALPDELRRYKRQIIMPQIGERGQRRLLASTIAIIGLGALGSVIATSFVRLGIGKVKVVDRDHVELDNLHRQILYDEKDLAAGLPKATAAAEKLRKMNSQVKIEPIVAHAGPDNIENIITDVDLVLDGTDNFETRFLINDACVKHALPWIYGGVIATTGMCMVIIPFKSACFRCLMPQKPPAQSIPTTATHGVLINTVSIIASLQVMEGLKILLQREEDLIQKLVQIDVWRGSWTLLEIGRVENDCPCCGHKKFEFLAR